jgi:hypothetical protein
LIEALGDIGVATPAVLKVIEPFFEHDRPLIRSAANRAMLQLTGAEKDAIRTAFGTCGLRLASAGTNAA